MAREKPPIKISSATEREFGTTPVGATRGERINASRGPNYCHHEWVTPQIKDVGYEVYNLCKHCLMPQDLPKEKSK